MDIKTNKELTRIQRRRLERQLENQKREELKQVIEEEEKIIEEEKKIKPVKIEPTKIVNNIFNIKTVEVKCKEKINIIDRQKKNKKLSNYKKSNKKGRK